ncbi:MAG: TrmH family RNA methyltransferase [Erysipelotrichaceae bacterium]
MDKYTSKSEFSYILGISLIVEALIKKPENVKEIILSSKAYRNKELETLLNLCSQHNIPVYEDDRTIEKLSLKENCYGIGVLKKYKSALESNRHLVLYNFKDEGKLGTIIRSAVSFDLRDIVLIHSDIDLFSPKLIRASMGSFFHAHIVCFNSFDEYLSTTRNTLIPFTSNGTKELKTIHIKDKYSIIIPSSPEELNDVFMDSYYIKHKEGEEVPLTSLSAIVFNYFFHQNADGKNT